MLAILTPAESEALDRASAERGVTVETLMENAGFAVARGALDVIGHAYGARVVVACGKGNNAGDGLVAARLLERRGCAVTVVLVAGREALHGPAAANLDRFEDAGGRW